MPLDRGSTNVRVPFEALLANAVKPATTSFLSSSALSSAYTNRCLFPAMAFNMASQASPSPFFVGACNRFCVFAAEGVGSLKRRTSTEFDDDNA